MEHGSNSKNYHPLSLAKQNRNQAEHKQMEIHSTAHLGSKTVRLERQMFRREHINLILIIFTNQIYLIAVPTIHCIVFVLFLFLNIFSCAQMDSSHS